MVVGCGLILFLLVDGFEIILNVVLVWLGVVGVEWYYIVLGKLV